MTQLRKFVIGAEAELGQAVVLIAIVLLGMLMMVGLAIDAGQLYSARRAMQEAADAAAYAAAVTLYQGGTQTQAFATAAVDSTTNGFTHNGSNIWITIQQPTTAPYNTDRGRAHDVDDRLLVAGVRDDPIHRGRAVHDRVASAFARGVGEGVLLPRRSRDVEEAGDDQEHEGKDQGELDQRLTRLIQMGERAQPAHQ